MTVQCVISCGLTQTVRLFLPPSPFTSNTCASPNLLLRADINGWGISPRGAGYLFGADITKVFAHRNGIDLIARAHQLAMEGYKLMFDKAIVTVWSAPNYCYRCASLSGDYFRKLNANDVCVWGRCGNVASILELDEHLAQEYKVFSHAPSVCR